MANNFYRMSTATTIENSGTGSNVLTKPAGVEVASIVPDKKYSVWIPSAATFTTDFNTDEAGFSVSLYTKPEPGSVIFVGAHSVEYTGHSLYIENEVGDRVEIPERSRRAHHILFTYNSMEVGLFVDGQGDSIPSDTRDEFGHLVVGLLSAGGILEHVQASPEIPSTRELTETVEEFLTAHGDSSDVAFMFDDRRDFVESRTLIDSITLEALGTHDVALEAVPCMAFKIEYEMIGDGSLFVNDLEVKSGYSTTQIPNSLMLIAGTSGATFTNVTITYYYTTDIQGSAGASLDSAYGSGTPAATHLHDDNAGNIFTSVFLDAEVAAVSGWFKAENGSILPGVSVYNGKLINTNYAGQLWEQATEPPAGTTHVWTGTENVSASEKRLNGSVQAKNYVWNPSFKLLDPARTDGTVEGWTPTYSYQSQVILPDGEAVLEATKDTQPSANILLFSSGGRAGGLFPVTEAGYYAASFEARSLDGPFTLYNSHLRHYPSDVSAQKQVGTTVLAPLTDQWQRITIPASSEITTVNGQLRFLAYCPSDYGWLPGMRVQIRRMIVSKVSGPGEVPGEFFDGSFKDDRANDLWVNGSTVNRWDSSTNTWTAVAAPTDTYVNGKPYANGELKDWFFATKNGVSTRSFDITAPTHALHTSDTALTANQVDDLYESFVGNAKLTAAPETITLGEMPAFIIATEWSIVTSG